MKEHGGGPEKKVWLSRSEVARLLEVAPVTIGRWASEGKLPYAMTLGGRRRFRREDVIDVVRRLAHVTAPPAAPPRRRRRSVARDPAARTGEVRTWEKRWRR